MLKFLLFFSLFILTSSYSYFSNTNVNYDIKQMDLDHPWDKATSGYHIGYPRGGIGCIASLDNDDSIYLISSQALLSRWNEFHRCNEQYRTVSIFKRNLTTSKNTKELVIGEEYSGSYNYKCYHWNDYDETIFNHLTGHERYFKEKELCLSKDHYWRDDMNPKPNGCYCGCCQKIIHPVGGKGSDHVVTCGIDSESNILYYIGANYHKCGSVYNTDSSLVRVNLTSFEFIDRTLLSEITDETNQTKWQDNSIEKKNQYFSFPGTSEISNGKIYLSFRTPNTGIWVINIREDNVKINSAYQVMEPFEQIVLNGTEEIKTTIYNSIASMGVSYHNKEDKLLYFISENFIDNAKVLVINVTNDNVFNNTNLIELNGINNIKKIKMDTVKKKIYLLSGQITSKLYRMDTSFEIIPLSETCNINSLEFPTEWKNAENLEIDDVSGYIYVFFIKKPYNGFITIRINDFQLNNTFNKFVFYNKDNQLWEPEYLNVSSLNRNSGKIFISNFPNENNLFMSYSEINMLGCSTGRRANDNVCEFCHPGTYSEIIGSDQCKLCDYGFSSSSYESNKCDLCVKGKYANLLGSTNCIFCQPGNYSENDGSKFCKKCSAGTYNTKTGSTTFKDCLDCNLGKYSLDGSESCNICELGKVTIDKKECIDCPKGKFSNVLGVTNMNQCINCPNGKYNVNLGSNNENKCIRCPIGKFSEVYGEDDTICKLCASGKYKNLNMNPGEDCAICENGKYSIDGMGECKLCAKGKYNLGTKATDHILCKDCEKGKYNNLIGADSELKCISCPLGKYSDLLASNSSSNCKKCGFGKYNDKLGAESILNCKNCPEGKYRNFESGTSINDCIDCSVGFYSLEKSATCSPCEEGKFGSLPSQSKCDFCNEGKYSPLNATITCESCPSNSESNSKFTKCECIAGTYQVSLDPLVCAECPDNFKCEKGSTIETLIVNQKYWRANKYTLHLEECKKGYNCVGGRVNNSSNDLCNVGHTGPICDVCKKGWAKSDGKCYKCLTSTGVKARSYFLTALIPIIISFVTFFMIKTANPSSSQAQKEPLSGVIKIFMNYAQIFTLASSFEINWPEIILVLFDRTKDFSSPKISFYSSDCTIGWNYYNKLLAYIILPIIYVIVVIAILSIYTFYFYTKKRNSKIKENSWGKHNNRKTFLKFNPEPMIFYKSWLCTSTLIGLFLAWPTIIKQSLSIIPCKKFGEKYYLLEDLSVECYTPIHTSYSILCYTSLIIYGILVPFIAFYLIKQKRFSLYDFDSKYEMPAPLSFLFLGYREETWYYEFIVMAKKYSLILITVFLKEYSRYQMICASLFVQAAFFIHVFLRPYDSISNYGILCNKLESISLLALVVTLNSGLFFGTINDQFKLGYFEIVLIALLLIMNALVMIYFLYYLIKLSLKESVGFLKKMYKYVEDKNLFVMKYISKEKKESLNIWSHKKEIDTHGINLKSQDEIDLFNHFFNDKKMFSHELKNLLKDNELVKLGFVLNKLRSKIEIIEKQRCWLSILNNRLYKQLRNELIQNKDKISENNAEKLNSILDNYIENGLKYSDTIDNISKKALRSIRKSKVIEMVMINDKDLEYKSSSTDESIDSDQDQFETSRSINSLKEEIIIE